MGAGRIAERQHEAVRSHQPGGRIPAQRRLLSAGAAGAGPGIAGSQAGPEEDIDSQPACTNAESGVCIGVAKALPAIAKT